MFNLQVDGKPEYFANGLLVHNCLVYKVRNLRKHRDPRPPPPVDEFSRSIDALNGKDPRGALARAFGVRR